jgi:signal transduction histidine kinase
MGQLSFFTVWLSKELINPMDHPKRQDDFDPSPRRYRYLSLLLLALACLMVSAYVFVLMRNAETYLIEQKFKQAAQSHFVLASKEIQRHYAKLSSLSQYYAASKPITRKEFKTYIEAFEPGLTNIQALQWIPRVLREERAAHEFAAHKDGLKGFRITERNHQGELVASPARDEYYPGYYVEPYAGNEAALGFDLASEEVRRNALQQARDSGQLAATLKVLLVQGQEPSPGIIAFYPIYRQGAALDTVAQRRQHLEGFYAGVTIYGSIFRQLFEIIDQLGIDHYVFVQSDQQPERLVSLHSAPTSKVPVKTTITLDVLRVEPYQEMTFKVGGVEITLIAKPVPEFFAGRRGIQPWLVLGAGLAFFMTILSYIAMQTKRLTLVQKFAAEQAVANEKLAEANLELEAFVYTVSHDLRSPLAPILGYAELLQDTYKERLLDDQAHDFLEEIQIQGNRMMTLMEDLLTLAKVGHLERPDESVDVQEVVRQVRNNLASSIANAGIEVRIGELPKLRVPEVLLTQIFDNLVGNAVRYAGNEGGPVEVGGERDGGWVRFFVRDYGPGIPEEERGRIFEVFFRGSTGKSVAGTGIGLATVKKIAKLYGGKAWVEETPGGGATFCVEMEG